MTTSNSMRTCVSLLAPCFLSSLALATGLAARLLLRCASGGLCVAAGSCGLSNLLGHADQPLWLFYAAFAGEPHGTAHAIVAATCAWRCMRACDEPVSAPLLTGW